jgi:hypothetical protein
LAAPWLGLRSSLLNEAGEALPSKNSWTVASGRVIDKQLSKLQKLLICSAFNAAFRLAGGISGLNAVCESFDGILPIVTAHFFCRPFDGTLDLGIVD